jgi:hypothetical protein
MIDKEKIIEVITGALLDIDMCAGDHRKARFIYTALEAAGYKFAGPDEVVVPTAGRKFSLGDFVQKISGSQWRGRVVGFYSTELTQVGYCVESSTELGSVQIYPEKALTASQEPRE